MLAASMIGLVLCVIGVECGSESSTLGYVEFGELKRLARKTVEQRQVLINNIAIRKAAEELKSSKTYDRVWRILENAFKDNAFDGFDLLAAGCRSTISDAQFVLARPGVRTFPMEKER